MLSEILKKKGYKFFRNYPFIDREEEIKFLKEFFEKSLVGFYFYMVLNPQERLH